MYVNFILEEKFALKSYGAIQQTIENTSKAKKLMPVRTRNYTVIEK